MKLTFAPAAALLLLSSCSDHDDGTALAIRDSAGIQIVENADPLWGANELWRVSANPILSIGEEEDDSASQFYQVINVVVLSDSTAVVADAGASSVKFFDKTGQLVRSIGRSGSGPGEFRALQNLRRLPADSLMVLDRSLGRVTIVDRLGEVSRTFQLPGRFVSVHPLSEGKLLAAEEEGFFGARMREDATPGIHRFPSAVVVLDPTGSLLDTVGLFPGADLAYFKREDRITALQAAYGRVLALGARNSQIYVGTGDRLGYDVYSAAGKHLRSVRAKGPDRRLTSSELAALHEKLLGSISSAAARERYERSLKAAPVPVEKAAFTRLIVDPLGHVWLSDYENSYIGSGVWRVFNPDGRYLGEVRSPPEFRIGDVGEWYVAGVWKDEMGVESVRVYALIK